MKVRPEDWFVVIMSKEIIDFDPSLTEEDQIQALGGAAMAETTQLTPGYLSTEFMKAREAFYVPREGKVFLFCGDDRPATEASADALHTSHPDVMDIREGYASIYSGFAGAVKNALVTGIVQYGPEFVQRVGGFNGMSEKLLRFASDNEDDSIIAGLHSAESNEENAATFNAHCDNPMGCAYCMGVGATSQLTVTNPEISDVARDDQVHVFGSDDFFEDLKGAHQTLLEEGTDGQMGNFAIARAEYRELSKQLPVQVLQGNHTGARTSGVISNFDRSTVGSATKAHEAGQDIYREDIAIAAEYVLRALPEYKLNPEILLRAFQLDSTSVRAVLASHDADPSLHGKLDPTALAMGVRGDIQQAIRELASI